MVDKSLINGRTGVQNNYAGNYCITRCLRFPVGQSSSPEHNILSTSHIKIYTKIIIGEYNILQCFIIRSVHNIIFQE